jgi:hypothetical protein
MQSALYFAFIRGREGEIQALRALSPLARARMTTVVDLPTMKEGSNKSIELHINTFASSVIRAWGTKSPIYLDMKRHASDLKDSRSRHQHAYGSDHHSGTATPRILRAN